MMNRLLRWCCGALLPVMAGGVAGCAGSGAGRDTRHQVIVSVCEQKMVLKRDGKPVKTYRVSTSKFGLGDKPGSNRTPLGRMEVAAKIGTNARHGAVFKNRRPTGEVLRPNAPGRDPIVTRILWLRGTDPGTRNAFRRGIYIHGTPEERRLGTPASYGCIRMSSRDVADLYRRIGHGAVVHVVRGPALAPPEAPAAPGPPPNPNLHYAGRGRATGDGGA